MAREAKYFLFLFLLLVDDVVVVFDARRADDVKSEDAVSADIIVKTYSPASCVSDVPSRRFGFYNLIILFD